MPKKQPTEPDPSRNSGSEEGAERHEDLLAAIHAACELEETRAWCGERRNNRKKHGVPPPNARVLEARVTDAVRRLTMRIEAQGSSQRKPAPARPAGLDVMATTYFSPYKVLEWISKHLTDAQQASLNDPSTDEHVCDQFLDAAVAQAVGKAQGLSVPELRARASALGWALVSPAQYADFYRNEVLPAWSRLGSKVRRCPECGESFALRDKRQRYCSDACSARQRNRGRQKVGKGRSAVEVAMKRNRNQLQRHLASCKVCSAGEFCVTRESMMQDGDALSRRSFDVTPELAEEMHAAQGRKRKRSAI